MVSNFILPEQGMKVGSLLQSIAVESLMTVAEVAVVYKGAQINQEQLHGCVSQELLEVSH